MPTRKLSFVIQANDRTLTINNYHKIPLNDTTITVYAFLKSRKQPGKDIIILHRFHIVGDGVSYNFDGYDLAYFDHFLEGVRVIESFVI